MCMSPRERLKIVEASHLNHGRRESIRSRDGNPSSTGLSRANAVVANMVGMFKAVAPCQVTDAVSSAACTQILVFATERNEKLYRLGSRLS